MIYSNKKMKHYIQMLFNIMLKEDFFVSVIYKTTFSIQIDKIYLLFCVQLRYQDVNGKTKQPTCHQMIDGNF